jgi:hypothetical protein
MKSRRKRLRIRRTTARNDRKTVYKYYPVDETKSVAVKAGRCYKCRKITTDFCFNCSNFVCEKHSAKDGDTFCISCRQGDSRADYVG